MTTLISNDSSYSILSILIFPKESEKYKEGLENLKNAESLEESTLKILKECKIFFGDNRTEIKLPLKLDNLEKLPNLFQRLETPDYAKLLVILDAIAAEEGFDGRIVSFLNSKLEAFDESTANDNDKSIAITILELLLNQLYGKNGKKLSEETKIKIHDYCGDLNNLFKCKEAEGLKSAFSFARSCLHHETNKSLRYSARDVCQKFNIKLPLSIMLRLSIDGVKPSEEEVEFVNNLVFVIGATGSGKSSVINYLCGVDYEYKISRFSREAYLKQKPTSIKAPAKVGFVSSETLYPQIIKSGRYFYCDFPGFNDNRNDNFQMCAELGLPIAVHYTGNIKAIIIVINWTTMENSGENRTNSLKNLLQILNSTFKEDSYEQLPLLFLITKPPMPISSEYQEDSDDETNSIFNADSYRKNILHNVGQTKEFLKTQLDEFQQENLENRIKLISDIKDLYFCVFNLHIEIKPLWEKFFKPEKNYISDYLVKFADKTEEVRKGNREIFLENQKRIWNSKSYSEFRRQKLSDTLNNIINNIIEHESKSSQFSRRFRFSGDDKWRCEQDFESMISGDVKKLKEELKKKINEQAEYDQQIKFKEKQLKFLGLFDEKNVFIVRGFTETKNGREIVDHKTNIIEHLNSLCDKNNVVEKQKLFDFDSSTEYNKVKDWAVERVSSMTGKLNSLLYLCKIIIELDKTVKENMNEMTSDIKFLDSLFITDSSHLFADKITSIQVVIENESLNLENTRKKLSDKTKEILNLREISKEINEDIYEFGSEIYIDERNWFGRKFGYASHYTFKFPIYYEYEWSGIWYRSVAYRLPIHHVEISSLVDSNSKVIFKTDFNRAKAFQVKNMSYAVKDKDILEVNINNEGGVCYHVQNNTSTTYANSGHFDIKKMGFNSAEGQFELTYHSNASESGYAGFKIFVAAKDFIFNQRTLMKNEKNIKDLEHEIRRLEFEKWSSNNKISEDNKTLDLLKRGIFSNNDKFETMKRYLLRLNYDKEKFKTYLLDKVKEKYQNTEQMYQNLEGILEWISEQSNMDLLKILINNYIGKKNEFYVKFKDHLKNFACILGVHDDIEDDNIKIIDVSNPSEMKEIDVLFLFQLMDLSKNSGLTLLSIHNLLMLDYGEHHQSFDQKICWLNRKRASKQQDFKTNKLEFENGAWEIEVLKTLSDVFKLADKHYIKYKSFKDFGNSYQSWKELKQDVNLMNHIMNKPVGKRIQDMIERGQNLYTEEEWDSLTEISKNRKASNESENHEQTEEEWDSLTEISKNRKASNESENHEQTEDFIKFSAVPKKNVYRILSIDGGGVRGIIPAKILAEIENKTGKRIHQMFNMIAGTSTGGIIAMMLALPKYDDPLKSQYSAQDVVDFYKDNSNGIFGLKNSTGSKYSNTNLQNLATKKFYFKNIDNSLVDLVIPSLRKENTETVPFNSYDANKSSINYSYSDVAMATSAAPTFFEPYEIKGSGTFLDGGIRANNPTRIAHDEFLRYKQDTAANSPDKTQVYDEVFILSIGTGKYLKHQSGSASEINNRLYWATNIADYCMSGSENEIDSSMRRSLTEEKYQRLQMELTETIALDDFSRIQDLEKWANEYIIKLNEENVLKKIIDKING